MSNSQQLLEKIEQGIVEHGGDLGGWTRLSNDGLQLFDGRVTLRCEVAEETQNENRCSIHAHIVTTLHEHDDESVDACVLGMAEQLDDAIDQAAVIWISSVAGPIKSFIENKPICMTCQAGVVDGDIAAGYSPGDYGLPGVRAYVGPAICRGDVEDNFDDSMPWFRFATESAAARRVHMAKVTLSCIEGEGWRRQLEIDGHEVSHSDPDWPAPVSENKFGYMIRYAIFEFPRNSRKIDHRQELDRTIRHFAQNYSAFEDIGDLMKSMVDNGFNANLVHQTESLATIAFGRLYFEHLGISYSPTIIRAMRDGSVLQDVPLMSLPAYNRGRAVGAQMREELSDDDFLSLCAYNAESNAILQVLEGQSADADLSGISLYPCVVPDYGVSDQTMEAALEVLNGMLSKPVLAKKPWWKFW